MAIEAIIFDLDGTLVDTEPLHFEGFRRVLAEEGIALGREEYFSRLIGYNDRDCFAVALRAAGREPAAATVARLIERKSTLYLELIATSELFYPAAQEFVLRCAARFPLMLATGTLRAEAEFILQRAGLRRYFHDIVAAEDVAHGKPAPDAFLGALERLNQRHCAPLVAAAQCLAIEDTSAGVEAARAAEMRTLGIAHTTAPAVLAAADLVRPSLAETDLNEVLAALERHTVR